MESLRQSSVSNEHLKGGREEGMECTARLGSVLLDRLTLLDEGVTLGLYRLDR